LEAFDFLGEFADSVLQCGVLGDQTPNAVLGQVGFQVADFADEFTDCAALREDFVVGRLETVFGVERAFTP